VSKKLILINLLGQTIYVDVNKNNDTIRFTLRLIPVDNSHKLQNNCPLTIDESPPNYEVHTRFGNGMAFYIERGKNSDGNYVIRLEPLAN